MIAARVTKRFDIENTYTILIFHVNVYNQLYRVHRKNMDTLCCSLHWFEV